MTTVFGPKDIESLSKFAALLAIPFLSAALYVDFGLWVLKYDNPPLLTRIISSGIPSIAFGAKAVTFMISVAAVTFAYEFANLFLLKVPKFMFFFGLTLLAFGVLGIGDLTIASKQAPANYFWNLGALCWGLHIFAPESK
jgi:hypothetical protein